jgi:hypothetical protein
VRSLAASKVGNLHIIEGIMNKHVIYVNIPSAQSKASAENVGIQEQFTFYNERNPKHFKQLVPPQLTAKI